MVGDSGSVWREQGLAALRQGDRAAAAAALERAVQANPQDVEAWYWLATTQADPRWAMAALERVLALNPHHPQALAGMAKIRAHLGISGPTAPPPPTPAPAEPPAQPAAAPPPAFFSGPPSRPATGPLDANLAGSPPAPFAAAPADAGAELSLPPSPFGSPPGTPITRPLSAGPSAPSFAPPPGDAGGAAGLSLPPSPFGSPPGTPITRPLSADRGGPGTPITRPLSAGPSPAPFSASPAPGGPSPIGGVIPPPFGAPPEPALTSFGGGAPSPFGSAAPAPFGAPAPAGGAAPVGPPGGAAEAAPSPFGSAAPALLGAAEAAPSPFGSAAPAPFGASGVAPSPFGSAAPAPIGGGGATVEMASLSFSPSPATPFGAAAPAGSATPPFGAAPAVAPPAGDDLDGLLRYGIDAAKAGRWEEAREALMGVVERDERNIDAWYWLSTVVEDPADIEVALENTLQLDPTHQAAQDALRRLRADATRRLPAGLAPPGMRGPAPGAVPAPLTPAGAEGPHGAPLAGPAAVPAVPVGSSDAEFKHLIGQVLGKRFRIIGVLGGDRSSMLVATDIRNGTYLLIKPNLGDPTASARNQITRGFEFEGETYAVTNLSLAGISLIQFIGAVGSLPPPQAVDYGLRMIKEARRSNRSLLERRSWHPAQITINRDGALDIAAPVEPDPAGVPGASMLSPPEHRQGGPLTERSDIYLIGALILYLITANGPPDRVPAPEPDPAPPADGKGPAPLPVATFPHAPDLAPHLAGVLATALQPAPAARYPTLAALEEALTRVYAEMNQVAATRQTTITRPIVVTGLVVFLLIFSGFFLAAATLGQHENPNLALTPPALNITLDPMTPGLGTPAVIGIPDTPGYTPAPTPTSTIFAENGREHIDHLVVNQVDARRAPQIAVYFSVVSTDNRPVGGLTKDDFSVTYDGGPVTDFGLSNLATTNETMYTFLTMDVSGSMNGIPLNEAKVATKQFVDLFSPGDQMGVISFNDHPKLLQDLTVSKGPVLRQIDGLEAFGNTALYDALNLALTTAAKSGGRTAIVLLSDGKDTASTQFTRDDVIQLSRLHSIPIHIIGLNDAPDYDGPTLQDIASHTGGEILESTDPLELVDLYKRLAYQIRGQYRMIFTGSSTKGSHEINISTQPGDKAFSYTKAYMVR